MSNVKTKAQAVLGSSNFKTDIVTILIGVAIGVSGFFYAMPDLSAAASLGADVGDTISAVKTGAWGAVFTAALKVYNVVSHMLKD